ncbi:GTP cyclohydrolase 1 type 2 [Pseudobythopirellula maris]|uniref:GTP cyclohydrolase 1 type 2 homolog n=1 Tax=Pseudobythopirellula maris TaxID=2527991 RepID=A0A5C5ZND0_9BACT|nr:Nif3-like dinuclear metal center hexameric protein [Pseudobythopirellula maris]TWT89024.1 GTP cyclohydrolase 1 type 2 [Pseudobythopirellula maris]
MTTTVRDIVDWLELLAPAALAEEWDNVGLLVGDPAAGAGRVMTCLTVTPETADEAIAGDADLVVAHHPMMFRPVQRLTTDTVEGAMLWRLAGAGVAVLSAHTAFDSAVGGINQQLAEGIGLEKITPFEPAIGADVDDASDGSLSGPGVGRCGAPKGGETDLATLVDATKRFLGIESVGVVGQADKPIKRVGLACGSGGSLLSMAVAAGCDALVTGEASFHSCLEARAHGLALLLTGHYASERFAMERMADRLSVELVGVEAWASRAESDPIRRMG